MQKIIYTNANGLSVTIGDEKPYLLLKQGSSPGSTNTLLSGFEIPKNDIYTSKSPDQDGETFTGMSLEKAERTITGTIWADNLDALETYRRELTATFNPKISGTLEYICGGIDKKCDCKVESIAFGSIGIKSQAFDITLLCPNPFWQDISQNTTKIAYWIGDFHFPLTIPTAGITIGHHSINLIVNVSNPGDVSCGMTVIFSANATVKNPSLFNAVTREYFTVAKTMSAGEIITVTTGFGNKKVIGTYQGATKNYMQYITDTDVTFLQLAPGDNYFRYNADSGVDSLECEIKFSPQYLGV
jgi:hypothetical protein